MSTAGGGEPALDGKNDIVQELQVVVVTLFSLPACQECERLKTFLRNKGVLFRDIPLNTSPSRHSVADQVVSGIFKVPQVYFNSTLVAGGEDGILNLYTKNNAVKPQAGQMKTNLETLLQHFRVHSRARMPPLAVPLAIGQSNDDETPAAAPSSPTHGSSHQAVPPLTGIRDPLCSAHEMVLIAAKGFPYLALESVMHEQLPLRERKVGSKLHRSCFSGADLVEFFRQFICSDRGTGAQTLQDIEGQAVEAAKRVLKLGIVHPLAARSKSFQKSEETAEFLNGPRTELFVLQRHINPFVMNCWYQWPSHKNRRSANEIIAECRRRMDVLKAEHTNDDGLVDHIRLAQDPRFTLFAEMTGELQVVRDILTLEPGPRMCFYINLYNLMADHAFAVLGVPQSAWQRFLFFDDAKYNVGGYLLSFSDIESGLLRCNRLAPFHVSLQFSRDDPRLRLMMPSLDPRFHFALNCGATSCPPIRLYTSENLDAELDFATSSFFEEPENFRIDLAKKVVTVSKIFHWFSVDFGGSHTTWLNRIRQWLARGIELQNDDGGGVPEQHRVSHVTAAQALLKNLCHLQGIEFRTQEGADKAVGEAATAQANKVPAVKTSFYDWTPVSCAHVGFRRKKYEQNSRACTIL